jgi:diadenosine tetraphosphatase ApaH/serine/threonine PP2A family protein phosphatase
VNSKIFCVQGGLSPNIDCVADLRVQIQKPVVDVSAFLAEHLLWSDPSANVAEFEVSPRRRGFLFGRDAVDQFLRESDLAFIVRAHQYCESGSKLTFDGCLTIFSASDYCGRSVKFLFFMFTLPHVVAAIEAEMLWRRLWTQAGSGF